MLADDGGPAVVVLSDDGKRRSPRRLCRSSTTSSRPSRARRARSHLSDQASLVPDDHKPPVTPEGEKKPLAERLADAKNALAGVHGA